MAPEPPGGVGEGIRVAEVGVLPAGALVGGGVGSGVAGDVAEVAAAADPHDPAAAEVGGQFTDRGPGVRHGTRAWRMPPTRRRCP